MFVQKSILLCVFHVSDNPRSAFFSLFAIDFWDMICYNLKDKDEGTAAPFGQNGERRDTACFC